VGSALEHVVIAGGGIAGARTCEQLRLQGYSGRLTMLSAESHRPYDRPPLSKALLLGQSDDSTLSVDLDDLDVDIRLGEAARALCTTDKTVTIGANTIPYDGLVIATGARPIRLPGDGQQYTVRTIDDARALRDRLHPGARVVVVGAGWIGAEVATAALAADCRVTCIEADQLPYGSVLGRTVGSKLMSWWVGVDLRLGARVRFVADGGVILTNGECVPADVVVSGVGCRPETEWLQSSELTLDRGVLVDEWLRAAPSVVAVGDVAAWWSRRSGCRMRVEHWDNAASGAAVAASTLLHPGLTDAQIHDPLPYFWSDQFGHKLQYIGNHEPTDTVVWREHATGAWSVIWLGAADEVKAALVADLPREFVQARIALSQGLVVDRALVEDVSIALSKCGKGAYTFQ